MKSQYQTLFWSFSIFCNFVSLSFVSLPLCRFVFFVFLSFHLFVFLSLWSNVWRVSSLKSHSLCQNSKVALTYLLSKGRYRAARAAKNKNWECQHWKEMKMLPILDLDANIHLSRMHLLPVFPCQEWKVFLCQEWKVFVWWSRANMRWPHHLLTPSCNLFSCHHQTIFFPSPAWNCTIFTLL